MESNQNRTNPTAPTSEPPEAAAGGAAGAPPSNTAPANSNQGVAPQTRILAAGIDSLYLSYPGTLNAGFQKLLDRLKQQAQSPDPDIRGLSQIELGGQLFEVSDKGARRFAYVLADPAFRIELARGEARALPMAHVQVSSAALATYGVEMAVEMLTHALAEAGELAGQPQVSRADIFVDAVTDHDLSELQDRQWVTRAHDIARYSDQGQRSGYLIGRGGDLSLRLYDKTLEMLRSGKVHARHKWLARGWNGETPVWRTEVQVRRTVLRQLGVVTVSDVVRDAGAVWLYALDEWCRLCVPDATDKTRSRWPMHPFWLALIQASGFDTSGGAAKRLLQRSRAPSDARIVDQVVGGVTTYMAREREWDFARALEGIINLTTLVHAQREAILGIDGPRQVSRKVAEKVRRYGTAPAHRVPQRIDLGLVPEPRQDGFSYEPED